MYDQSEDVKKLREKKALKESNNNIDFKKLVLKLLLLIIVIFSFVYIVTTLQKGNSSKQFESNFILLKNAAYNFYIDNDRPANKNDSASVSLRILKELGYLDDLKIKKNISCNESLSQVEIVKDTDTRYKVNASLTCGNETKTENYLFNFSKDGNNGTTILYLLKKDVITNNVIYQCPDNYYLQGTECFSKNDTKVTNANIVYKVIKESDTRAFYKRPTSTYEFIAATIHHGGTTFTCPFGSTEVNGKCYKYDGYKYKESCPNGYNQTGNSCYQYINAVPRTGPWSYGTLITSRTPLTEYEHDDEKLVYVKEVVKKNETIYYYRKSKRSVSYMCPNGILKNKNQCYITTPKTNNKYCTSGYSDNGTQCQKEVAGKTTTGKDVYTCPADYDKIGSGPSTKCRKTITSEGYYYCTNPDASLIGERCVIPGKTIISGYSCPTGYKLNGTKCYQYNKQKKEKATRHVEQNVTTEKFWNKNKELAGWTFTGETKQI